MSYAFEVDQQLIFTAMDDDTGTDDPLGVARCSLAAIVNSKVPYSVPLRLRDNPVGSIQISYEKVASSNKLLNIQLRCEKVKDVETFSKSDPFVRFFRVSNMTNVNVPAQDLGENDWREAHATEHVNDNLNPKFQPFEISSASLCGGNPNSHIKLEIWDHSNRGEHKLIGKAFTSLA